MTYIVPPEQEWEQPIPGESKEAFRAFVIYRDSPYPRSIDRAYCQHKQIPEGNKKASGRWRHWCGQFFWVSRTKAFDRVVAIRESAEQSRIRKEWRKSTRDSLWNFSRLILERVEEMMSYPIVEMMREEEDGRSITIIKPARWNYNHVAQLLKLGTDFAKVASGMPQMDVAEAAAVLADAGLLPDSLADLLEVDVSGTTERVNQHYLDRGFAQEDEEEFELEE